MRKRTLGPQRPFKQSLRKFRLRIPNENSANRIEGKLRKNPDLWKRLHENIPGIVISRKPVEKLEPESDEVFCIKLNYEGFSESGLYLQSKRFATGIMKIRSLVNEDLAWQHRQLSQFEAEPSGVGKRIFEAVEINPGIAGFRIDLKKLFNI